jgi:hypothetical protein
MAKQLEFHITNSLSDNRTFYIIRSDNKEITLQKTNKGIVGVSQLTENEEFYLRKWIRQHRANIRESFERIGTEIKTY